MGWEIQGQRQILSTRSVIVTTVCTFIRHITQNRYSALKFCTEFSSRLTHNALQDKLENLDLVSFLPNGLGNTKPASNIEYKVSYSDNNLHIYTSYNSKPFFCIQFLY